MFSSLFQFRAVCDKNVHIFFGLNFATSSFALRSFIHSYIQKSVSFDMIMHAVYGWNEWLMTRQIIISQTIWCHFKWVTHVKKNSYYLLSLSVIFLFFPLSFCTFALLVHSMIKSRIFYFAKTAKKYRKSLLYRIFMADERNLGAQNSWY